MRKNKPQNLNEQLSRMKRLMNFDIGEHSHDKLTEQEYKKIVTEQVDWLDKLKDDQAKAQAKWRKGAEERISDTMGKLEQFKDVQQYENAKNNIKSEQNIHGFNIFNMSLGAPQPLEVNPPKVEANYYDNMVTIENGVKNKGQLVKELDKVIFNLKNTSGFKPENVILHIQGAANNLAPTITPGGNASSLDHPGSQPFGGINVSDEKNHNAGNLYLAEKRAESVKKYIEEKIPGITITTSGKVMPGESEEEKFIKLSAKYKDEYQERQMTGKPEVVFENRLEVKTGKELGAEDVEFEGSTLIQDPNQRYYKGIRTIKVRPANGEVVHLAYDWFGSTGNNPIASKGTTGGPQRQGTWTDQKVGRTSTARTKQVDRAEGKVVEALSTSGYFENKKEVRKLIELIKDGDSELPFKINGFGKLTSTFGVGNSNFDRDLAIKNGAYVFDEVNKKIQYPPNPSKMR